MSVFQYLIKDLEGKRKEGEIRAESLDLAVQKLTTGGQMVISLKEADDTLDFLGPFLDEINLSVEKMKNRIPLGRVMTAADLKNALDIFLDPDSSYITGQNLIADGGVSIW